MTENVATDPAALAAGPPSKDDSRPTAADLKKMAAGKWHFIFEDLLPELNEALGAAPDHVTCPVHGGMDGFRLFEHYNETGRCVCNTCGFQKSGLDTILFIKRHRDPAYSIGDAIRDLATWLKVESAPSENRARRTPTVLPKPRLTPEEAFRIIERLGQGSAPLAGTPAERYLRKRGIWLDNLPKRGLRSHPGMRYIHGKQKVDYGVFPGMLAPVRALDGTLVALHRTFLTEAGDKAPVPDAKKLTSARGDLHGTSIQLFPVPEDCTTMGLAEGIETALAAHAISRMPVWACVNAVLMEFVHVPPHVTRVVIWADLDASGRGMQAANVLADRLEKEGKTVEVYYPQALLTADLKGVDWLDVLLSQGIRGFPAKWRRWRPADTPQLDAI